MGGAGPQTGSLSGSARSAQSAGLGPSRVAQQITTFHKWTEVQALGEYVQFTSELDPDPSGAAADPPGSLPGSAGIVSPSPE